MPYESGVIGTTGARVRNVKTTLLPDQSGIPEEAFVTECDLEITVQPSFETSVWN
jgi:hypothetical protein